MKEFFDTTKTIIAVSTPIGAGGISIVRMSGPDAVSIADSLFVAKNKNKPSMFENRKLVLGNFLGENIKENCLCVVFRSPDSFTGEDIVEFQCHGGIKITENILKECIKQGAKLAENGEFSMRAFLNGKISLAEAEGIMDMINAESDAELRAGYALVSGVLSQKTQKMQDEIIDIMSEIEVSFDYPEEDFEYITNKKIVDRIKKNSKDIDKLLSTAKTGAIVRSGIKALIIGKPNVGKSSLLNTLLGKEKAIVTNIPGTTRDIIEDSFVIKGIKVNIIDTAGIGESQDIVEMLGVKKAKDMIKESDIILFVIDASEDFTERDREIYELIKHKKHIIIENKSDIKTKKSKIFNNSIEISAKTSEGIEELKNLIYDNVIEKDIIASSLIITNSRHEEALKKANKALNNALSGIKNTSLDAVAVDIMDAFYALGEITGTSSSKEIINSIFSKFCLGK